MGFLSTRGRCARAKAVTRAILLMSSALPPCGAAFAAEDGAINTIETVYVWGMREDLVGEASSASEGVVDFAAFSDRPLLRVGELLEVVPGLAATQHSGTGKANQYFVRGFNIDHGTDFSASLDGIPFNLPTHGHGQGYLDLNPIIPELVETIRFRKGPYFADAGDFSSAGTASFDLFDDLPQSFAQVTGGEHRYWRFLGAARLGEGNYIASDHTVYDGPWTRPEDLKKISVVGRASFGGWSLTGIAYDAAWNSADQIPLRAIEDGTLSRFGVVDPTDGGQSSRNLVYLQNRDLAGWNLLAYGQRYDLDLWSNFAYFLDDPVNGDQFQQVDDRWVYGASASRAWTPANSPWGFAAGLSGRYDDIKNVALHRTAARQILSTVRSDSAGEWALGAWAEAEREFGPLRAIAGLRFDAVGAEVDSDNLLNSGSESDALVSPKLALAWQAAPDVEFYADAGRGFHSNDARGATISVDPNSGLAADPVSLLVPSTGAEIGGRYQGSNFSAAASLWWLKLDSELVFVGDAGSTEASDGTKRAGVEVLFNWRPVDRIEFDLSAAATHARFTGDPPGGNRIPNALEYVVTAGVSALVMENLTATVTLRHLGNAPLIEDNSVRSDTATVSNLQLRYQMGRFALIGEVLNLFDNDADDIQYFYGSRLPGEAAGGVEDFHIHPAEPITFRVGLRAEL